MGTSQKGFTAVEGLLIVLALTVVGFGGYFVWSRQNNKDPQPSQQTDTSALPKSDSKDEQVEAPESNTYSLKKTTVSFAYPTNWNLTAEVDIDERTYEKVTLTAPDTSEIEITVFKFLGGFSGDEPYEKIKDLVEASNGTTSYAMLTTAPENVFVTSSITLAEAGKYKVGEDIQALPHWFSVKLEDGTKVQMSITVSGPGGEDFGQSEKYKTLAEFQALDAYKAAEKFMESLKIQ